METDTKTGLPITYKQAPGGAPYPSPSGQIGVTAHPPSNEANTQYGAPPGAYGPSVPSYPAHSSAAAQPLQPPPNQTYFITNVPAGFGNLEGLIPIMPLWAAITLCVVNCIMPGFGEFTKVLRTMSTMNNEYYETLFSSLMIMNNTMNNYSTA